MNASTAAFTLIFLFGLAPSRIPQEQATESQSVDQVAVMKSTGTVQNVDLDKRKLTIRLDDGKTKTLDVGRGVKNLNQFKAGDRVQVSSTEEIIMMAEKSDHSVAAVETRMLRLSLPHAARELSTAITRERQSKNGGVIG